MTGSKTNISSTAISTESGYVELLAKSNFSFLQGASHPEEMVLQAQTLGYNGLGLCDLNGMYGVVRAFQAIAYPSHFVVHLHNQNPGFQFFTGTEMQFTDIGPIAFLAMNKNGYMDLCRLITLSKRQAPKGYINLSINDLPPFCEDLIALPLPPWKVETLQRLIDLFKDRLYLPVLKDYTWEATDLYQQALQIERQLEIPIVATQRPLMHARERKPLHDVLTCILHKTQLREAKTRLTSNGERHLKSLPELRALWADRPDALARTLEIARRLHFSLTELKYEYPQATVPAGQSPSDYLRLKTTEGLHKRFPEGIPDEVWKTVEHELALIKELEYEDYFLTLWDICLFAKSKGILYQGRGSAANSIVCYALELTAVDPTKVKLLFERFISKERGEPPDIDIDFQSDRREEVIQHIYEKYGSDHAAMVCTIISYRSRMAVRECAKVLGVPLPAIDRMIKFMGREGLSLLEQSEARAHEWGLTPEKLQRLVQIASALKGFPRHLGIHSGGFLIAKRPITECVPVEKATMDKRFVIQWNKDDLTVLKMLKIDVLGLGMLGALQRSLDLLRTHKNLDRNLATLDQNDESTYEMIQRADTVGTFQIESRAQMSLLPRLKPKNFYDLVVEVAIVRPGPIQGGMVHPYIRRRHGLEPVVYPHEALKRILAKTFGVPIFQEQIMQIASTVGGFTPGEADELRRIMSSSWKKADLMKGLRERLINGMLNHGISLEYAEQIYQTIVGFSAYGFPESHAASFALLTYASCYIKRHHPEIFVTALLNSQPMGFYSPRALIADAQRHGVKFRDVDLQRSEYDYTLEAAGEGVFAVRSGFQAIFGLQREPADRLVEERRQHGPFRDLQDLAQRTRLPKRALMLLGAAGALNALGLSAREALWRIQSLQLDERSLFWGRDDNGDADLPSESEWEKLHREYHTKGYSVHHHPLSLLRPGLSQDRRRRYARASDLERMKDGDRVTVAGLLSLQQRPPTAKGFAFLTLEDETGFLNAVLLPEIYVKYRLLLMAAPLLTVSGRIQKQGQVIHLKATHIEALPVDHLLKITHGLATSALS